MAAALALALPSLPSPLELEREPGVLTLTAPDPPSLGVNMLQPLDLGLLREDGVGSVLKEAAVRIGGGERRGNACGCIRVRTEWRGEGATESAERRRREGSKEATADGYLG